MVNFLSVACVPLVQPINSYHMDDMVIRWFEGGRGGNDLPHHVNYHTVTLRLTVQCLS